MTDYAEKECVACGLIAPANQMVAVTEEARVGRSSGRWSTGGSSGRSTHSSGGHTSYGTSNRSSHSYTSGQDFYETQRNWYCGACDHARRLAIAARRRATLIVGGIVVAVVAAAVIGVTFADRSGSPAASPSEAVATNTDAAPMPTPSSVDAEEAGDGDVDPPASEVTTLVQEPLAPPPEAAPAPEVAEDSPQYRALLVSLETGEPARWNERGGFQGFVSVSELQDYPDRRCRSFYYRTTYRGETNTTETQMTCQAPGGVWQVQP